ncbi:hypothetical protein M0R45_021751 [Rubus argutus]|uniref:Anthranilate phosphoribosyltransferase n=1 Tax=Rubus argutus TaxID=59490 RepID=A0AAW1XE00_RUBAR
MKALLNPEPLSFTSFSSISTAKPPYLTPSPTRTFLKLPANHGERSTGVKLTCTVKATLESITIGQSGICVPDTRNPTVSSSYRDSNLPKPNQTVLEAQTRVCTGPTQTKPLAEDQALKVLDTIFRSATGELKDEEPVSRAQLGAFFAAMTIRANCFPEATQWSEGESRAMNKYWPLLVRVLPPDVVFIADPEGSLMGIGSSIGPQFSTEDGTSTGVSESLLSALLIGQRMNRETDRELKAYCLAFDDELGETPIADVKSLTHYGEPYDGNTRFFRSTLFVAAVRSCYAESSLLHGAEWMPPKGGVTEEQMLKFMGADTSLTPAQAKVLLEDEEVGFAYISHRESRPSLYSLVKLREHIKKRPPLATSEKVQQFVKARGKEAIVTGFYHEGYEEPLLMLMKRRGVHSGLVVKGEEGALSMTTRLRSVNSSKGIPVNYCSGFRSLSMASACEVDGVSRQSFNLEVNAIDYGFEPTDTPRTDRSVLKNIELGLTALHGQKGPAYDRIVLNAGMVDHLLGCDGAEDISVALDRAREAIDSGKALERLWNYIKVSKQVRHRPAMCA